MYIYHDDVIKWKHFPRYWPFVRGIHRFPVNSPHKDQWHGAFMFSLICTRINGWVNNAEAGDLRRHLAHNAVTVMTVTRDSPVRKSKDMYIDSIVPGEVIRKWGITIDNSCFETWKWTDIYTKDSDNNDDHSKYRIFFLWVKYDGICVLNHLDNKFGIFHMSTFLATMTFENIFACNYVDWVSRNKHCCVQYTIGPPPLAHLINSVVESRKSQNSMRLQVWLAEYSPRIIVLM